MTTDRQTIIIRLDPTGQVQLTGPLNNPILCHGLLGMATHALNRMLVESENRILPIGPAFLPEPPPKC